MQSEKAKALEAQQKAAAKAERERKKHSDDPRDWGRTKQIIETWKQTNTLDPELKWWTLGACVAAIGLVSLLGIWMQPWWLWLIMGVLTAVPAALYVLTWRAKKASYGKYDGQVGAAELAFGELNNKKYTYQMAVAATRQMDVIHRVLGEPGIVLVGEGNPTRVRALLTTEAKRYEQVAYGVKVTPIIIGKGDGRVALPQLAKHIQKLPKTLQPHQITDVKQRLRALDAVRPKAPIPRGPMPAMKGVKRAMRGR